MSSVVFHRKVDEGVRVVRPEDEQEGFLQRAKRLRPLVAAEVGRDDEKSVGGPAGQTGMVEDENR